MNVRKTRSAMTLATVLLTAGCSAAAISPVDAGQDQGQDAAIQVTPRTAWLRSLESMTLAATVTGTGDTAVTWSILESGGGVLGANGRYTAPATPGTYHVVVTSAADPSISTQVTVMVVQGTGASQPMSLLSRSVPATSSAGTASSAQVASYGGTAWGYRTLELGGPGWVAYDLSGVAAAQRQSILVALYMGKGDQYYQLNYRLGYQGTSTDYYAADSYVLEGATSSGGPWTALATASNNDAFFKSHLVNFAGYTWLRFRALTGSSLGARSCNVKMDVYDASGGITDGIVFYGDSITTNVFSGGSTGGMYPPEWFSKGVQAAHPDRFPFVSGGGYPFMTAGDAAGIIVGTAGVPSGSFASGLPATLASTHSAPKYAALLFGTNDAAASSLVATYHANMRIVVDGLRAQGQTVVLAVPPWADPAKDSTRAGNLPTVRAIIGYQVPTWSAGSCTVGDFGFVWNGGRVYRCTTSGTSVTGPTGTGSGISDGGTARWAYVQSLRETYAGDAGVIGGPDLYSVFYGKTSWLDGSGIHPSGAAATGAWEQAWVSWANASLYP